MMHVAVAQQTLSQTYQHVMGCTVRTTITNIYITGVSLAHTRAHTHTERLTYTHRHTHTHIPARMDTRTHTQPHKHTSARACKHTHTHAQTHTNVSFDITDVAVTLKGGSTRIESSLSLHDSSSRAVPPSPNIRRPAVIHS